MDDKADAGSFWIEEINGEIQNPIRKKRKYVKRKKKYDGWGSTSLIRFLASIGMDTSNKITQSDVTRIINEYVKHNSLLHPTKKKRIVCDERLHSLFGRKSISRLKINDLLESHFAENRAESDDDILFNSDDDEDALGMCETPKTTNSERKNQPKKLVIEKPKSCFAAIIPVNLKLVYLRRSLVEEILKDPETFEAKVVGGFIRIKRDPNDFLQRNSHLLLQVTGIKKGAGMSGKILLQVSGFIKDIRIPMLSDDNFCEEECEDLCQRVKDGLLKRPTIVDIERIARALHEDMTKHWIARELKLLQNLIDRANEKGWRKELYEYLERREKLQNPVEQKRLLHEIPQVVADDLESESPKPDVVDEKVENNEEEIWQTTSKQVSLVTGVPKAFADGFVWKPTKLDTADPVKQKSNSPNTADPIKQESNLPNTAEPVKQESNSPKSILSLSGASEVPLLKMAMNGTVLNCSSHGTAAEHQWSNKPVQQQPEKIIDFAFKSDGVSKPVDSNEAKISEGPQDNQVRPSQPEVIELSDDEENEEPSTRKQVPAEQLQCLMWYYRDPQGNVQGPFSLTSLKRWSDARYFPLDFKVWKAGQSQYDGVLLVDILDQFFPS